MAATISPFHLRPLIPQLDGRVDYGQPLGVPEGLMAGLEQPFDRFPILAFP